jgi:acyl-CoA thioesterase FadM
MNLILRLLWQAIFSRFRSPVSVFGPCRTSFTVLPTDLDVLMHVNNGVYLSMMDLARIDLMQRSGLFEPIYKKGWYPVVVAQSIWYRRSLRVFQRFVIETRVLGWDEKAFVIEQRFECRGDVVAHALVRGRFRAKKGGNVAPADIVAMVPNPPATPTLPEYAARWNADHSAWRGS